MPNYKKLYYKLAGNLADVIDTIDKLSSDLKNIQLETEEACINDDSEAGLVTLSNDGKVV